LSLRLDHQFSTAFKIYGSYTYNYTNYRGRPSNIHMKDFDGVTGADAPLSNAG
jgi:hypothetical protein